MYVSYNSHPEDKINSNGAILAVSKVMNLPWHIAFAVMSFIGSDILENPDSYATMSKYLNSSGFKQRTLTEDEQADINEFTVKDFCKRYPFGTYVLMTNKRAIAVVDGKYYDAYDSGNEIIIFYWVK